MSRDSLSAELPHEIPSSIDSLVSAFRGMEFGPLHYRYLEWDKDMALKSALGSFDMKMSLSTDSIGALDPGSLVLSRS